MINSLTALRFVFALMVFLLHICNSRIAMHFDSQTQWLAINIFKEGYIGVGFFFILSGFIMAYTYKDKFVKKRITKINFWVLRFARIYPLHLLTLFASIPLLMLWNFNMNDMMGLPFAVNFYLLQAYILPEGNWFWSFNSVSWSISNEAFFYLLFPAIIFLLTKNLKFFIIAVLFACAIIPILMYETLETGFRPEWFYIHPVFRLVDFLVGILLFEIYIKLQRSKALKFMTLLELFSLMIFFCFFIFHNSINAIYRFSCYYWLPISFIILVFSLQRGYISRLLSNKYMLYFGKISYGFYMFHALIIEYFIKMNQTYIVFSNYYLFVLFLFGFSILVSSVSYYYFEQPVNSYLVRKFVKKG